MLLALAATTGQPEDYCAKLRNPEALYTKVQNDPSLSFDQREAIMKELDLRVARCNAADEFKRNHPRAKR